MNNRVADFRYLVFGGGGAAGVAFAGAMDELIRTPEFSLEKIKEVAGTSVGSIAALMVILGFSPAQFVEQLGSLDLKKLQDGGGWLPTRIMQLFSQYGLYKGQELYNLILYLIAQKTLRPDPENVTFDDLAKLGFKKLHIVTTKLYLLNGVPTGKRKVFSPDRTPHTAVASAILASAAAPLFFQRVRMKKVSDGKYVISPDGDLFSDGGLINNFPIDLFDNMNYITEGNNAAGKEGQAYNPHTLGLAVLAAEQIVDPWHLPKKEQIGDRSPCVFTQALVNTLGTKAELDGLEKDKYHRRTIQIDRKGVGLSDFGMSEEMKKELVESGRLAVKHYFEAFRNPQQYDMKQLKAAKKKLPVGTMWDKNVAAERARVNEAIMFAMRPD